MSPRATIAVGLLTAAAFCGALWIAYSAGHGHGVEQCQLAQAKQDKIDKADRDKKLLEANKVQDDLTDKVKQLEQELAERKPEKEIIYQTITKEVTKYAQSPANSGCVADPDFVRIWNAAKDGRDPTTARTGKRGNAKALPDAGSYAKAGRSEVDDSGDLDGLHQGSPGVRRPAAGTGGSRQVTQ